MSMDMSLDPAADPDRTMQSYVTVTIADQLFGLPLPCVQDVFRLGHLTPVPLAGADIAGVLNLRGRIVTVVDMRAKLGLPEALDDARKTAVGIHWAGESYGLVVDRVGDVRHLSPATLRANPPHLDPAWATVSEGVHQLDDALMIVLSVDKVLSGRRAHAIGAPADKQTLVSRFQSSQDRASSSDANFGIKATLATL